MNVTKSGSPALACSRPSASITATDTRCTDSTISPRSVSLDGTAASLRRTARTYRLTELAARATSATGDPHPASTVEVHHVHRHPTVADERAPPAPGAPAGRTAALQSSLRR